MRIIVSEISDTGIEESLEIPLAIDGINFEGDTKAVLKFQKFGDRVLIDGLAKAKVSLVCSRCLKDFSCPVEPTFRVEYAPSGEANREEEQELKSDEMETGFYKGDEIDIDELLREQILLAIPMKPLCKTNCPGLCPKCGKDLSEGGCNCAPEIDPRLLGFKRFLKNS